jgi:uncharacterized protein
MSRALDAFSRLAALRPARRQENHRREISSAGDDSHFPRGISSDIPPGAERLAQILGASSASNRYGEHLALRRWFSEPVVAGDPCCAAPDGAINVSALRLIAPGAPDEVADPRQWLFLDTETTGLCGGSGTYPFLVGIAWWDAGGLEVEQFFMRDHSEEHSVLLALSERLAERRVLVTFNGKSFDWPLLETRYRMTRAIHPPQIKAHLDFLHPARNLWRLRLGSVRLAELERQVLGWNRGADIISELIPSIYFDFLRGGSPDPLVPIFHHNQMDLRGLAALASRVVSVLANPESHGPHALDIFGVSRICERRGEAVLARKLYARSIAAALPPETDRLAKKSLARLAKRDGDFELACELWQSMAGNSREGFEAYEQLAIHYERRAREPHRAAILIRQALAELRKANRLGIISSSAYRKRRERFDRRLARLERRTERQTGRHTGRSLLDALQTTTSRLDHAPGENKESA